MIVLLRFLQCNQLNNEHIDLESSSTDYIGTDLKESKQINKVHVENEWLNGYEQ